LADETITGNPEVYKLASYRLPETDEPEALMSILQHISEGEHPLVKAIPDPLRRLVRLQLDFFLAQKPTDFDLRGASLGNLILTGGYLNYQRHLDPILYLYSKLLAVKGVVRPTITDSCHLVATFANGEKIIGQHRFSGKESAPIDAAICGLSLSSSGSEDRPVKVSIDEKVRSLIGSADLICYPPGSFYSSVIANLLPQGVGKAIAENTCPKVYIPNLGSDPEQYGMSLDASLDVLLSYLQQDAGASTNADRLLNYILLDSHNGKYPSALSAEKLRKHGIVLIDTPLVSERSAPYYDDAQLVHALLSLS
jgi:CofD-related protein of GAK system